MPTTITKSKPPANNNDREAILAKAAAMASTAANNNKRKRQVANVSLDAIPRVLQHHVNIINLGGCPRCNSTKAKLSPDSIGGTVQKYGCKNCKKVYHENTPRPPILLDGVQPPTDYQVLLSKDEQMFLGKGRLQQVATRTYAEITKREIHQDKLIFEQKKKVLQHQLKEKRRKIFQLLGLPFDDDDEEEEDDVSDDDNAPLMSLKGKKHDTLEEEVTDTVGGSETESKKNSAVSGDTTKGDKSPIDEATKAKSTSSNPFRDTILLLRCETHKLEHRVSLHQHHQAMIEGGEDEEVDITNDAVLRPRSKYQLASRIIQEGGDEVTIYEVGDTR